MYTTVFYRTTETFLKQVLFKFIYRSSQSVTSPPMTPRTQRSRQSRQLDTDGYNRLKSLHVDTDDYAQMNYAAIPCGCSDSTGLPNLAPKADHSATNNVPVNPNAYENYDIPRSLCKQVSIPFNVHLLSYLPGLLD